MRASERAACRAAREIKSGWELWAKKEGLTRQRLSEPELAEIIERHTRVAELEQATPHLAINRELSDLREKWNAAERRVTELEQALAAFVNYLDDLDEEDCPGGTRLVAKAKELLERQKESG